MNLNYAVILYSYRGSPRNAQDQAKAHFCVGEEEEVEAVVVLAVQAQSAIGGSCRRKCPPLATLKEHGSIFARAATIRVPPHLRLSSSSPANLKHVLLEPRPHSAAINREPSACIS
jgi:hypothetical protein